MATSTLSEGAGKAHALPAVVKAAKQTPQGTQYSGGSEGLGSGGGRGFGAESGVRQAKGTTRDTTVADFRRMVLPAPFRPRRHKYTPLADRAARVRLYLQFGPEPLAALVRDMGCTRYALRHTLRTMPDVVVDRGVVRLAPEVAA